MVVHIWIVRIAGVEEVRHIIHSLLSLFELFVLLEHLELFALQALNLNLSLFGDSQLKLFHEGELVFKLIFEHLQASLFIDVYFPKLPELRRFLVNLGLQCVFKSLLLVRQQGCFSCSSIQSWRGSLACGLVESLSALLVTSWAHLGHHHGRLHATRRSHSTILVCSRWQRLGDDFRSSDCKVLDNLLLLGSELFILTLSIPELFHHFVIQSGVLDHILEGELLNNWLGRNRYSLVDQFQGLWEFREFSSNVESLRIEVFVSSSKEHVRDTVLVLAFDVI